MNIIFENTVAGQRWCCQVQFKWVLPNKFVHFFLYSRSFWLWTLQPDVFFMTYFCVCLFVCLFLRLCSPARAMASSYHEVLWSAHRRDLYLTHNRTCTWHTTDKHPCPIGIRTHDRSRRAAVDLRLRPRGHWDRRLIFVELLKVHVVQ
jgi:hypothetical protein